MYGGRYTDLQHVKNRAKFYLGFPPLNDDIIRGFRPNRGGGGGDGDGNGELSVIVTDEVSDESSVGEDDEAPSTAFDWNDRRVHHTPSTPRFRASRSTRSVQPNCLTYDDN